MHVPIIFDRSSWYDTSNLSLVIIYSDHFQRLQELMFTIKTLVFDKYRDIKETQSTIINLRCRQDSFWLSVNSKVQMVTVKY